jgi:hypothetical protein
VVSEGLAAPNGAIGCTNDTVLFDAKAMDDPLVMILANPYSIVSTPFPYIKLCGHINIDNEPPAT